MIYHNTIQSPTLTPFQCIPYSSRLLLFQFTPDIDKPLCVCKLDWTGPNCAISKGHATRRSASQESVEMRPNQNDPCHYDLSGKKWNGKRWLAGKYYCHNYLYRGLRKDLLFGICVSKPGSKTFTCLCSNELIGKSLEYSCTIS